MPSFTVATWNILATAYIRREYYPHTAPRFLDAAWRVPALVSRARELAPDIFCLQEVERPVFAALEQGLDGYTGRLAMKDGRKPDGCAVFFRTSRCRLASERRLVYADAAPGGAPSGHVAQVIVLDVDGTRVTVVNTHLKWDPPERPREARWDYRQAQQALQAAGPGSDSTVEIICGDFNATPDSAVMELLTSAGFRYAHRGEGVYSCNSGGVPKLIDFVCVRGLVEVEACAVPAIEGETPLPSAGQPSDHLPLMALVKSGL